MFGLIIPNSNLQIQHTQTPKGRGVFARRNFRQGEIVETTPVLLIHCPWDQLSREIQAVVYDWAFLTSTEGTVWALALGPGSLVNHSDKPNLSFEADVDLQALVYRALIDIPLGDELTIDYNADIEAGRPDWFSTMGVLPV